MEALPSDFSFLRSNDSGTDTDTDGELTAEEFIKEVNLRVERYAWDKKTCMSEVLHAICGQGPADNWLRHTLST